MGSTPALQLRSECLQGSGLLRGVAQLSLNLQEGLPEAPLPLSPADHILRLGPTPAADGVGVLDIGKGKAELATQPQGPQSAAGWGPSASGVAWAN